MSDKFGEFWTSLDFGNPTMKYYLEKRKQSLSKFLKAEKNTFQSQITNLKVVVKILKKISTKKQIMMKHFEIKFFSR